MVFTDMEKLLSVLVYWKMKIFIFCCDVFNYRIRKAVSYAFCQIT